MSFRILGSPLKKRLFTNNHFHPWADHDRPAWLAFHADKTSDYRFAMKSAPKPAEISLLRQRLPMRALA
jgi:hypothetical protein